jgi:hypothetical protein
MRFETRLRRQCSACTESSIRTYTANIKALAKLAGLQEVPDSSASWLDADLLQICKNETLGRYKRFAIAGRKALQDIWLKCSQPQRTGRKPSWSRRSSTTSNAIYKNELHGSRHNGQTTATKRYSAWQDSSTRRRRATFTEQQTPSTLRRATCTRSRGTLSFCFTHGTPCVAIWQRRILPKGQNYIYKKKDRWHLHIGEHKTVRAHGAIDFALAEPVHEGLDRFLPYVRATSSHGYLLSTMRRQSRLQRHDMLKMIRRVTEERLGKRLGVQMIRVLRVTEAAEQIDESAELRAQMGHTAATQFQYVSK